MKRARVAETDSGSRKECKMKNLWVANWRRDVCAAELEHSRKRQSLVQSVRFTVDGKHYIYVEEVMFLMERGLLLLFVDVRNIYTFS